MKIKKKHIIISMLVIFVIIGFSLYNVEFNLPFEEVYVAKDVYTEELQKKHERYTSEKNIPFWQTLKAAKYGTLDDSFHEETEIDEIDQMDLDKENYTYFVVFGHKLKKITYSYSKRFIDYDDILPKQFAGQVVVEKEADQNVYVYKTRKININNDFQDISKSVTME